MGSLPLHFGFVVLSVGLLFGAARSIRSKAALIGGAVWLGATAALGASGWLADFSGQPPRMFLVLVPLVGGAMWLAFSSVGSKFCTLPLGFLIGFQSFRILVELLIHQAVAEGVAPPQMTWTGLNWDVLSGLTAIPMAIFHKRLPARAIQAWNLAALGLLLWIVGVAVLSFPTPFQQLHPDNTWVAHFPYIWLPTACVFTALLGHLVLMRKLARD